MNFAKIFPADLRYHTYICKIPDIILKHSDEHFLKYEADKDGVLVKPIDSKEWFTNKTIVTATNPDTNKPYEYIRVPFGCLEKIINFSIKHYENLEKNIPTVWELNENNWEHMKLTFMSEYRQTQYYYRLLEAELSSQSISKQMTVMCYVCYYVCLVCVCV